MAKHKCRCINTPILFFIFSVLAFYANAKPLNSIHTNVVFVDNANVREQPSIKAKVIGKLKHGTSVKECYLQDWKSDTIGGVADYWKPIQFKNGVGYIWQPILADGFYRSAEFKEDVFMLKHNAIKGKNIVGSTSFGKTFNSKGPRL